MFGRYSALDDERKFIIGCRAVGVFFAVLAVVFVTVAVTDIRAHGGVAGAKGRVIAHQIVKAHTEHTYDLFGGTDYPVPRRYLLLVRSTDNETQDWVYVTARKYARQSLGSFYEGPLEATGDIKPLD